MNDVIMGRRIVIWLAVGLAMACAFATGFELHSRSVKSATPTPPRPSSTALRTAVLAGLEQGYYKPIPKTAYSAHSVDGVIRTLDDPYTEYLTPGGLPGAARVRARHVRRRRCRAGAGAAAA